MTRRTPNDPAFNRAIREEIEGTQVQERVIFYDRENNPREAIYSQEFSTNPDRLQEVRQRLEDSGELKAIVHIRAYALASHGPRITLVEYLPENFTYAFAWTPPYAMPIPQDADGFQQALTRSKELWGEEADEK